MGTLDGDSPDDVLSGDVLSDEPVMPEIPLKPNNAIPVTIGVIEIIGGIGLLLLSALLIVTLSMADVVGTTEGVSADEGAQFQALVESGQLLFTIVMFSLTSVVLIVGGTMLVKKKRLGVYISAGGGALFGLTMIAGEIWMAVIAEDYGFSYSLGASTAIQGVCSLLCLAFPLLVLLFPQGKAALS